MEEVDDTEAASENAGDMSCCASCGIAEVDDVQLTACTADCNLVRYCSVACQRDHRSQHEAMCKKRVAELRDGLIFAQPERCHLGDCPLCFLPMPIPTNQRVITSCCTKIICRGCSCSDLKRQTTEALKQTCPFCRELLPGNSVESDMRLMRRAETNDPIAIAKVAHIYHSKGDHGKALECWKKAAALGDAESNHSLSLRYWEGKCIEKDEKRQIYHMEEAAIAGHPTARFNLGSINWNHGRFDTAVKHWIIAANLGYDESMKTLKQCYVKGLVSKDDFAAALRSHHAAVCATKSPQREAAAKAHNMFRHLTSRLKAGENQIQIPYDELSAAFEVLGMELNFEADYVFSSVFA